MTQPEPHFHRPSMSIRVPHTYSERESDYVSYLSVYAHENVHYVQTIGTSYGHFVTGLDALATKQIKQLTRVLVSRCGGIKIPLKKWARVEPDPEIAGVLKQYLARFDLCGRVERSFSGTAGTALVSSACNDLKEVMALETQVLPWLPEAARLDDLVPFNRWAPLDALITNGSCELGASDVMETFARYQEYLLNATGLVPRLGARRRFLAFVRRPFSKSTEVEALFDRSATTFSRMHDKIITASLGSYARSFDLVAQWIPEGKFGERVFTFFVLADLALMTPIGSMYYPCWKKLQVGWSDIHPGMRLIAAALKVKELKLGLVNPGWDYESFVKTLCEALDWPSPLEIVNKGLAVIPERAENPILQWQRTALALRRDMPWIFSVLQAPLNEKVKVPVIFYRDGFRTAVSQTYVGWLGIRALEFELADEMVNEGSLQFDRWGFGHEGIHFPEEKRFVCQQAFGVDVGKIESI